MSSLKVTHEALQMMGRFWPPGDPYTVTARSYRARRLLHITAAISGRAASAASLPTTDRAEFDVRIVAYSYLRAMVTQGRAIAYLADSGGAEASYSNLRSLFELYVDFRYLLLAEGWALKARNARRVILYAMRDLREHSAEIGFSPEIVARMAERERIFSEIEPEMYAQFEKDWSERRRGHWSGKSRSAVIKQVDPSGGMRNFYKVLSWESHGVLGVVADVDTSNPNVVRHVYRHTQAQVARFVCDEAARALLASWRGMRSHGWWQTRSLREEAR